MTCPLAPLHAATAADPARDDEAGMLHVALPRKLLLQHRGGVPVIYYGAEVLSFDDPSLAPLSGLLAAGAPFDRAALAQACPKASAASRDAAIGALLDLGLLSPEPGPVPQSRPADPPALPAAADPRDWRDAEAIGRDLAGAPVHPAHLELVVPVFRIAHPVLDADNRQVGEANVFPRGLRLDRPTEWRSCTYPGTRHMDDKPMNVTALKAMREHWPEMMAVLAVIRARALARAGLSGALTLGQIERLCIAVLALPTWESFRGAPLDPVLSSLFRVTDGLRIVVHQMMFVPSAEPMLPPEAVVDAAALYDYAERSLSFHSDTGVCAGPQHFIREFLSVLVEGAAPRFGAGGTIGPAMRRALLGLDQALDYGFAALAAHAATFVIWTEMAEAWDAISRRAAAWPGPLSPAAAHFAEAAAEAGRRLAHATYLGRAPWRQMRRDTYAEMESEAARLTRWFPPAPRTPAVACPDAADLALALPGLPEGEASVLATILAGFATRAGAHLTRAAAWQARIADRLSRPAAPGFALRDLTLHTRLVADPGPRLPFLPDALAQLTGLTLDILTQPWGDTAPGPRHRDGPGRPTHRAATPRPNQERP